MFECFLQIKLALTHSSNLVWSGSKLAKSWLQSAFVDAISRVVHILFPAYTVDV